MLSSQVMDDPCKTFRKDGLIRLLSPYYPEAQLKKLRHAELCNMLVQLENPPVPGGKKREGGRLWKTLKSAGMAALLFGGGTLTGRGLAASAPAYSAPPTLPHVNSRGVAALTLPAAKAPPQRLSTPTSLDFYLQEPPGVTPALGFTLLPPPSAPPQKISYRTAGSSGSRRLRLRRVAAGPSTTGLAMAALKKISIKPSPASWSKLDAFLNETDAKVAVLSTPDTYYLVLPLIKALKQRDLTVYVLNATDKKVRETFVGADLSLNKSTLPVIVVCTPWNQITYVANQSISPEQMVVDAISSTLQCHIIRKVSVQPPKLNGNKINRFTMEQKLFESAKQQTHARYGVLIVVLNKRLLPLVKRKYEKYPFVYIMSADPGLKYVHNAGMGGKDVAVWSGGTMHAFSIRSTPAMSLLVDAVDGAYQCSKLAHIL